MSFTTKTGNENGKWADEVGIRFSERGGTNKKSKEAAATFTVISMVEYTKTGYYPNIWRDFSMKNFCLGKAWGDPRPPTPLCHNLLREIRLIHRYILFLLIYTISKFLLIKSLQKALCNHNVNKVYTPSSVYVRSKT